jgi:succinylglutamate desuccinylase
MAVGDRLVTGPLYHRIDGPRAIFDLFAGTDTDVLTRLDGKPALLHLPGTRPGAPARLISTLLHGNEDSGFRGLCRWLQGEPVVRQPLWLFIGNVRAATQHGWYADRYLDDQEDFNRVWGITPATTRMRLCAQQVFADITRGPLEAAVDIHNNTGDNPLYAIVPEPNPASYGLAAAVADIGLLWGTQSHTLMQELQPICPAVAVECGMAGVDAHVDLAVGVIETFLAAGPFGGDRPARMLEVRHRVEVRREVAFDFDDELPDELDLVITPGLDAANFGRLPAGTVIGRVVPGGDIPFEITDGEGVDTTAQFLALDAGGAVRLTRDVIPAMMTRTPEQTRRDCLFYILDRA